MKVSDLILELQKMPQDMDFCYSAWIISERGIGYQHHTPKNPIIKVESMGQYGKRVAIMECAAP